MSKRGENITKRKDGRWEARYIKGYENGKAVYGYLYGKSYAEAKNKKMTALSTMNNIKRNDSTEISGKAVTEQNYFYCGTQTYYN